MYIKKLGIKILKVLFLFIAIPFIPVYAWTDRKRAKEQGIGYLEDVSIGFSVLIAFVEKD